MLHLDLRFIHPKMFKEIKKNFGDLEQSITRSLKEFCKDGFGKGISM